MRSATLPPRRAVASAVVLSACVGALSACGGDDAVTGPSQTGAAVAPSDGAYVGGHAVDVMLPVGRLTLDVSDPVDRLDGNATADGRAVQAAPGTQLVGVRWVLAKQAYGSSVNDGVEDLTHLARPPSPTSVTLTGPDGTSVDGPTIDSSGDGPRSTWLVVPADGGLTDAAVTYDGLTQHADLTDGRVDPGVAAPLYTSEPTQRGGSCRVRGDAYRTCLLQAGIGYAYVASHGWAPEGSSYVVISLEVGDDFDDAVRDLRLAGSSPVFAFENDLDRSRAFLVPDDVRVMRLTAETDDGHAVRGVLTRPVGS